MATRRTFWGRWGMVAACVLMLSGGVLEARQKKLKLATLAPRGSSYHQLLLELRDKWREAPGGGAKLIIYPDGQMGGESDMVRRMRVGQIDISMMTAVGLAEIDESITALQNMPLMFNSFAEVEYVRGKLRPMIVAKFKAKGFQILFLGDVGWVKFFSRSQALGPDSFQKLKIFSSANDPKSEQLWKRAGFQPVALDLTAMLPSLKTGMVDVVPSPPAYANAAQLYDPAPYMIDLNWAPLVGGIIVRSESWMKLKAETRTAMAQTATQMGQKYMGLLREENQKAVEAMVKRGLHVLQLNEAQRAAWQKTAESFYPEIRGAIVPADLFDRVRELLETYRGAQREAAAGS